MNRNNNSWIKKSLIVSAFAVISLLLGLAVMNLDLAFRLINANKIGALTSNKIFYELAS